MGLFCDCGILSNFIVVIAIVAGLFYLFFKRKYTYWDMRGVYTLPPVVPFGNMVGTCTRTVHFGLEFSEAYERTSDRPYVGLYMIHKPTLLVNDLDVIRTMVTKDFAHFTDHGFPFDENHDPLAGHLFNLGGLKWKNLRAKLTPTFTSSKMKMMFDVVAQCAGEMSDYLDETISVKDVHDVKDLMGTYANDVIANCAFGIECKSFKNPDEIFRTMGKKIFTPTPWEVFTGTMAFFLPEFSRFLGVKLLNQEVENFFYNMVEETVSYREKNGVFRNDFMQLLIQLKNNELITDDHPAERENNEKFIDDGTHLTMKQLAAQVFVFFIAGFDTSSSAASFALYELAKNPDLQKTLVDEIDEVLQRNDGKITYDSLNEMHYLTKVIEETLRKYPPLPVLFRICTKEYVIPDTDIVIEKDTPVMIPLYAIQRDPRFFPDPEKFDPERFSPENKESRHRFSYMPFGEGPRLCIGNRFGMMQTRLGLVAFLSKYEVSVCEETAIPITFDKNTMILASEGGLWLRIKKRNK